MKGKIKQKNQLAEFVEAIICNFVTENIKHKHVRILNNMYLFVKIVEN